VTTPRTNDLTVFSLELGGGGYLLEISEQKDTGSLDSWCTARVFRLYEVGNFNRADPIRTIAEGKPAFVLGALDQIMSTAATAVSMHRFKASDGAASA
jgi:hypothetical protein